MVEKQLEWGTVVDGLGPSFDPSFLRACKEVNMFCPRTVDQHTRPRSPSQSYLTILSKPVVNSARPSRRSGACALPTISDGISDGQLAAIQSKIFERQRSRISQDYDTSDWIRDQLFEEHGVVMYDTDGVWCVEDAANQEYICGYTYDDTVWREKAY
jgi:hypothetical protein